LLTRAQLMIAVSFGSDSASVLDDRDRRVARNAKMFGEWQFDVRVVWAAKSGLSGGCRRDLHFSNPVDEFAGR
jgi:hypothetical protein